MPTNDVSFFTGLIIDTLQMVHMNEARRLQLRKTLEVALAADKAALAALATASKAANEATINVALAASNRAANIVLAALAANKDADAILEAAKDAYKAATKKGV